MVVLHSVDAELDEMKRFYHGLDYFLSEVASRLVLPDEIESFAIVYFPQLGFLIKILLSDSKDAHAVISLEFQFAADEFAFYKNHTMKGTFMSY